MQPAQIDVKGMPISLTTSGEKLQTMNSSRFASLIPAVP